MFDLLCFWIRRSLHSLPVFQHFTSSDPAFSETFSIIISKLGHLGNDWLKKLIHFFLYQFEESASRYIIKPIAAIVGHEPLLFRKEILERTRGNINHFLTLLAFFFFNCQDSIEELDLMQIAMTAVKVIGDEESNASDLDSSLQLLSVKSKSFNLEIGEAQDDILPFKVWNNPESAARNLNFAKVSDRPAVYLVNLPFRLMIPNEEDSISVLAAKFKSLGTGNFEPVDVCN